METLLQELGKRGLSVSSDRLLGMLAERLPDWAPPPPDAQSQEDSPQAAVRAMSNFISLADNQDERQHRYAELVDTAVAEFNSGSLGRAVTLLDLAGSMVEKKEVDSLFADSAQRRAHGKLDPQRLRRLAEDKEQRQLLRRLLGFFQLLSPSELLSQLDGEPDRNKRKFLLDLLRVHQSDARQVAFSELADLHAGSKFFHWFYTRNLVHLLRTIPRDPETPVQNEIDVLVPLTGLENEVPLIREALATFGQLSHERAVTTLAARVNEVEEILLSDQKQSFRPDDLLSLLDIMIKSLAKITTPSARRYVVVHGFKRQAKLGNTLERMTWLADQDLSGERDIVTRLIAEIRNELPRGILSLSRKSQKKQQVLDPMVRTLASTKTPEVIELLTEIKSNHSGLPVAATAAEILGQMQDLASNQKEQVPSLSGDLALFGLPNLLQNLADSQISGLLKVLGSGGGTKARVWMQEGRVLAADGGRLYGEVVVYQLLEDPAPGQFVFGDSDEDADPKAMTQEPMSVQSVLFEGIRRYDEFNRAAAVVPDGATLSPTGAKPTPPEVETDGDLVREVWRRASAGYSPVECEAEIAIDRFRIRCLYEHWVTEGSLELVEMGGPSSKATEA
jgi:HEAT repeat protein